MLVPCGYREITVQQCFTGIILGIMTCVVIGKICILFLKLNHNATRKH